ncbi:CRISPR-associated endonuclease Cas1, partial [Acinetobacter baumannii]
SGSVSFDVLGWLAEQNTALVQLDWQGNPVCVVGGSGYCADPDKVAWQVSTRADPQRQLAFAKKVIGAKLTASVEALASLPASRKIV